MPYFYSITPNFINEESFDGKRGSFDGIEFGSPPLLQLEIWVQSGDPVDG